MKKKPKKEPSAVKPSSSSRKKTEDDDGKKKKQKKKKDPNAPKRAITAFMFFSSTEREVCIAYYTQFVTIKEHQSSSPKLNFIRFLNAECEKE